MSADGDIVREALEWQKSLGAPSWTTAGKSLDACFAALARLEAAAEMKDDLDVLGKLLKTAVAQRDTPAKALRGTLDQRLLSTPGVNPDGTVSSYSMAECLARAALTEAGPE